MKGPSVYFNMIHNKTKRYFSIAAYLLIGLLLQSTLFECVAQNKTAAQPIMNNSPDITASRRSRSRTRRSELRIDRGNAILTESEGTDMSGAGKNRRVIGKPNRTGSEGIQNFSKYVGAV